VLPAAALGQGGTPPELVEQAEIGWLAKALTLARRENSDDLVAV